MTYIEKWLALARFDALVRNRQENKGEEALSGCCWPPVVVAVVRRSVHVRNWLGARLYIHRYYPSIISEAQVLLRSYLRVVSMATETGKSSARK